MDEIPQKMMVVSIEKKGLFLLDDVWYLQFWGSWNFHWTVRPWQQIGLGSDEFPLEIGDKIRVELFMYWRV